MIALFKKEFAGFLHSLTAYLVIGIFLIVTGALLWIFPNTSILEFGDASLESLFQIIPYAWMFLIPALTMGIIAQEKQQGTFELLCTLPLSDWQIILGKYFACFSIITLTLLPTGIYFLTVYQLGVEPGNLDVGATIGSYVGVLLLGAAMVSIGLFASSITDNQIIAFSVAVFLSFWMYSGWTLISGLFSFADYANVLQALGFEDHYQALSRGVLDSRDVVYFLSVIVLFLAFTKTSLARRLW